jgi:2-acylglycerol O-acyltransferase 2
MMGICDASKESCNYILKQGNGNSILLVLGGSKEALDARPSSEYLLTLKNRKGFVKIALANGASLVPVFSFGENDLYEQVPNPRGSMLRTVQTILEKKMGYSLPLFHGRGVFQYKFGLLPNRHPIDAYVGEPIEVPKLSPEQITTQIIDEYHTKYMNALTRLFDTYKAKHGNANASIVFVDDANV